jgi:hypothetical protein
MSRVQKMLSLLAIALAAIFTGIAAYISAAEQPARLALADGPMLTQWKVSFALAFLIQSTLAMLTGVVALAAWWRSRDWRWVAGAALILANWPWTVVMIAPISAALQGTVPEAAGLASRALIEQWGYLHGLRTGLGLMALVVFLWAAGGDRPCERPNPPAPARRI